MSVTYSEKAKRLLRDADRTHADAITTKILDEYPYPPVHLNWDVAEDAAGGMTFLLRGQDAVGTVERRLDPDELTSDSNLRFHLYRICGDLIGERSRRLVEASAAHGEFDGPQD